MRERVLAITGNVPIILVAPHGVDDINTGNIVEGIRKRFDCYAVINWGFERNDFVDVANDKADCNRVNHCQEDIVREEFLLPIRRYVRNIQKNNDVAHIFYIHGCGDHINQGRANPIDCIIGYGLGVLVENSLTCNLWRKNNLIHSFQNDGNAIWNVAQARASGKYAGRNPNNMVQYFRKHELNPSVQSMQLEIPYSLRKIKSQAINLGEHLSYVLRDYYMGEMSEQFRFSESPETDFI